MGFQKNTMGTERILTDNCKKYYRLIYSYMRNKNDALNAVQENAYRAIKDCGKIKDKDYLFTRIYRIAVNTALNLLQKKKKETLTEELPEIPMKDQYQETGLWIIPNQLDHKSKPVTILRYPEDLKLEDIADILGDNLNTVEVRLYRSLEKLKLNLEAEHYKDVVDKFQERIMLMKQNEKERMDVLKQGYDHTPVPKEAETRMQTGIVRAERGQKSMITMKPIRHMDGAAATAILTITPLADLNPTTANTMEQMPIIGSIAEVITFRTFRNKRGDFETDIQVPQVTLGNSGEAQVPANKSVEEYANEFIIDCERELVVNNSEGHYGVDSRYKMATNADKYLPIRIDITLTVTSGIQLVKIFTIDKTVGDVITLAELLKNEPTALGTTSNQIEQQTGAQMATDKNIIYFYHSKMSKEDFKGPTGDESCYLNQNDKLVTIFNEYDVAPGYMRTMGFIILVSATGTF